MVNQDKCYELSQIFSPLYTVKVMCSVMSDSLRPYGL